MRSRRSCRGSSRSRSENVRLQLGQTITVDPKLEVGGFQDRITVAGGAPVVDVKASSAQKNLTEEHDGEHPVHEPLRSRRDAGRSGRSQSARGTETTARTAAVSTSSNSYMVDGVDVSDPESGTIWLFSNHNWIQEVQVIGLGADAEYGGFTGVASNSLFRSGSNQFPAGCSKPLTKTTR